MSTDQLLALQKGPDDWVSKDELLFQVTHQSTELWLKLAHSECEEALALMAQDDTNGASACLRRSTQCIRLIRYQLDILSELTPWDFLRLRPVLGNGSGFESPGWRSIRQVGAALSDQLDAYVRRRGIDMAQTYVSGQHGSEYRLFEDLIDWDESVSLWRARHYKLAERIIGQFTVGTKGTPVSALKDMPDTKFFLQLWRVRSELAAMSGTQQVDHA
ncbi:tryptophan 2,3-dioxygenase [Tateyamaria omphalii]|nr:tryptophan 2,3-dioxygenase [Tateyamaria omphalii]